MTDRAERQRQNVALYHFEDTVPFVDSFDPGGICPDDAVRRFAVLTVSI
jgi:hypothetical protein